MSEPVVDFNFGREVSSNLLVASEREWLVTNGLGGFAMGTISGELTRRYHGLLIAALQPPLERTLLVTALAETAQYAGQVYPLSTFRWAGEYVHPHGYHYLESFRLEGSIPVWTYACADALLEKRIWMQPGSHTTYVQYRHVRGDAPFSLKIKALVNYRDDHGVTIDAEEQGWVMQVEAMELGLKITAAEGAAPYYLLCQRSAWSPRHEWYPSFMLSIEQERGFDGLEDHLWAGELQADLAPGEELTVAATLDPGASLDGGSAYARRREYELQLVEAARQVHGRIDPVIERLALAADQFIVQRPTSTDPEGRSILAGFPWFTDWGRDSMISLPGLTLATGRLDVARSILHTFAQYVDQGMIPNCFADMGGSPEYNTADATLWYFQALRAYLDSAGDEGQAGDLLRELFPILQGIIDWHDRGTRYQIRVDPQDGLLYAGEPGVQLTWMDARVGDWVVTPRVGKPVEINALWYNALRCMADFAARLGEQPDGYLVLAERTRTGFQRFWNERTGYCYDVLDGRGGDEAYLRPNQLFAVSLPYSPLPAEQQRAVVDACARWLLTSHGLRSLEPGAAGYVGHYRGDVVQRDGAYHNGAVWSWLIGPFVEAHLRVYGDKRLARSFLLPLVQNLRAAGVGSLSEIFDGDPPFAPRGCIAQAWSVAEMLRMWIATEE